MKKNILFVSQDSGSGNALFLIIKTLLKEKTLKIKVFATKQSKKIFSEMRIHFIDLDRIDFNRALDYNPDLIVTGASMRNCIEKEAILYARDNQIKTVTILDFWSHYWERFSTKAEKNITLLPDYIFVMDNIARDQMISEGFPENKLIVTGNPYFDTFEISDDKKTDFISDSILFVSQPVYHQGSYKTDYSMIADFFSVLSKFGKINKVLIRPHPKDEPSAFARYSGERVLIDYEKDIKDLIRDCKIVIGKNSTVLFEAVFRGKLVISYQPNGEQPDRLITNQMGLSYLARSKSELESILKKALHKQLITKKLGVIKYYNDGYSTERVIKYIKKLLA